MHHACLKVTASFAQRFHTLSRGTCWVRSKSRTLLCARRHIDTSHPSVFVEVSFSLDTTEVHQQVDTASIQRGYHPCVVVWALARLIYTLYYSPKMCVLRARDITSLSSVTLRQRVTKSERILSLLQKHQRTRVDITGCEKCRLRTHHYSEDAQSQNLVPRFQSTRDRCERRRRQCLRVGLCPVVAFQDSGRPQDLEHHWAQRLAERTPPLNIPEYTRSEHHKV